MRVGLVVQGIVQGVGFRPFVHRTARERGLTGWVRNGPSGVRIEVQGDADNVEGFARALERDLPPPAAIACIVREALDDRKREDATFQILPSDEDGGAPHAPVLPPDLATCAACWTNVRSAEDRRHAYPFTNCSACGPRYSIVRALPYDRPRTSMSGFAMCGDCAREYSDVVDRRHHAQPIACPRCGPELTWCLPDGRVCARGDLALREAVAAIAHGQIVALRGIGGFQLLCDATRSDVVAELRARKGRPHKPFAVMFANLTELDRAATISDAERAVLDSAAAPIVLVRRRDGTPLAEDVAPGCPEVGALLPNTPLHGLLLAEVGFPIVCTSGNRSEEPLAVDTAEALARLSGIADGFLSHNRPIERPLDDSVVRVTPRRTLVIRRARGYAPRSVGRIDPRVTVLAVGAHQKSTVTLGHRGVLIPSQHLGDLDSPMARELLRATVDDLVGFFDARPEVVACDLHPDYASTTLAERLAGAWGARLVRVQHHHAHVAAVAADRGLPLTQPALGLAWDGSGLGTDGTVWGGEALVCRGHDFDRFAHLRPFSLPGGDRASRDPRRCALGLLAEVRPDALEAWAARWFGASGRLHVAACRVRRAPCSSVGRLFDAIAALVELDGPASYEGQTACALEHLAETAKPDGAYPLPLVSLGGGPLVADTSALVDAVLADARRAVAKARIARRFHESLVELGVAIAERAGLADVVLSGGSFQNRLIAERLEGRLLEQDFRVHVPSQVPTNDGGISVGQAWIAASVSASGRPPT